MRIMPKKGYYVTNRPINDDFFEAVYTTGIRGGGGHKWCRPNQFGNHNWARLLWSCVPSQKKLDAGFTYYEKFEDIPKEYGFKPVTI